MKPLVLKLGGSLAESGRLRDVLAVVARARRPLVIVPGGGSFAEAVRETQRSLGFSDETAHTMALLAMRQMGDVLCALEPRLVVEETLSGMARAWRRKQIPVWHPVRLSARDRLIPHDWTITSDGLAARLAERLGGAEVMVVKSCCVPSAMTASALAHQGIVDAQFPVIVARADLRWRVLGPDGKARLAHALGVDPRCRSAVTGRRCGRQRQAVVPRVGRAGGL